MIRRGKGSGSWEKLKVKRSGQRRNTVILPPSWKVVDALRGEEETDGNVPGAFSLLLLKPHIEEERRKMRRLGVAQVKENK